MPGPRWLDTADLPIAPAGGAGATMPDRCRPPADPRSSFLMPKRSPRRRRRRWPIWQTIARQRPAPQLPRVTAWRGGLFEQFSPWLATGALSARQAHGHLIRAFEAEQAPTTAATGSGLSCSGATISAGCNARMAAGSMARRACPDGPAGPRTRAASNALDRGSHRRRAGRCRHARAQPPATCRTACARTWPAIWSTTSAATGGAGAAWFEAQLLDYDCCSNQGNWLYIAGRGTDPRGGRRFQHEQAGAGLRPGRRLPPV